ncbi:MAG: flagellar hook-basal body complex protein FliE [Myxococcota bacterium]
MIRGVNGLQAYARALGTSGVDANMPSDVVLRPNDGPDFTATLTRALGAVETQHATADSVLADLASGDSVDLHATMIELEKADIALRTLVSVRDKFIAAYEQVMNMNV